MVTTELSLLSVITHTHTHSHLCAPNGINARMRVQFFPWVDQLIVPSIRPAAVV